MEETAETNQKAPASDEESGDGWCFGDGADDDIPENEDDIFAEAQLPGATRDPRDAVKPQPAKRPRYSDGQDLKTKMNVMVHGLTSAKGKELNGLFGTLKSFESDSGRWEVDLDGVGSKSLKSENLREVTHQPNCEAADPNKYGFCPKMAVKVWGLESSKGKDLNGLCGILKDFDRSSGRWMVDLEEDGNKRKIVSLRPENLEPTTSPDAADPNRFGLCPNMKVAVHGLGRAKDLNGVRGVLKFFDGGTGRWQVELNDVGAKLLKPENLREIIELPGDDAKPAYRAEDFGGPSVTDLVEEEKQRGNVAMGRGDYGLGIRHFTTAIDFKHPDKTIQATLYSNRSAGHAQLKRYEAALEDAIQVIKLRPNWARGYARKGFAEYNLNKKTEAELTYQKGLKIAPDDVFLNTELNRVQREIGVTVD